MRELGTSRTLLYISVNRHGQCMGAEFRRPGSPVFGSAETGGVVGISCPGSSLLEGD